mmetsp:Transcript_5412/g.13950  ORF Transcript_5412/g.13950 Transcript_5412/m.13950 type:complete len:289 (+) Transcript_5412:290-1156(+)
MPYSSLRHAEKECALPTQSWNACVGTTGSGSALRKSMSTEATSNTSQSTGICFPASRCLTTSSVEVPESKKRLGSPIPNELRWSTSAQSCRGILSAVPSAEVSIRSLRDSPMKVLCHSPVMLMKMSLPFSRCRTTMSSSSISPRLRGPAVRQSTFAEKASLTDSPGVRIPAAGDTTSHGGIAAESSGLGVNRNCVITFPVLVRTTVPDLLWAYRSAPRLTWLVSTLASGMDWFSMVSSSRWIACKMAWYLEASTVEMPTLSTHRTGLWSLSLSPGRLVYSRGAMVDPR